MAKEKLASNPSFQTRLQVVTTYPLTIPYVNITYEPGQIIEQAEIEKHPAWFAMQKAADLMCVVD